MEDSRKKRHDILEALRTLEIAAKQISEGYRFEDSLGTAKIQHLTKAVHLISQEMKEYLKMKFGE